GVAYRGPRRPPPATCPGADSPSPRSRCSMYMPAKPAPTTTASKIPVSGARACGAGVFASIGFRPGISSETRDYAPWERKIDAELRGEGRRFRLVSDSVASHHCAAPSVCETSESEDTSNLLI